MDEGKTWLMTELAELGFADEAVSMSVRAFSVREGLDRGFEVLVTAGAKDAELDLDRVAGRAAALRLWTGSERKARRSWSGTCHAIEQLEVEPDGLSIYLLRIVPDLFRLAQRTNRRLFQHQTAVEIATSILAEWHIEPELRLHGSPLPRHELRVQLDETDLAFVSRLLEEAGVSYWFEQTPLPSDEPPAIEPTRLVLGDEPHRGSLRLAQLEVRSSANHAGAFLHARDVKVSRTVRSGRISLRGHEFRGSRELQLLAEAHVEHELERRYERYRFSPGAFLSEPEDGARTGDRVDERAAEASAKLALERERAGGSTVRFTTNALQLEPGCVFSLTGHARTELCHPSTLLVVSAELEGETNGEWRATIEATPTARAHRPQLVTPKPRAHGLESAIVVGARASDDEIHVDAHGRVKVQFHWDREGANDERSSCWLRVSQAWAGSGHGFVALPRVGSEVLVGFFEGDPDRPLVVGRAHNRVEPSPYALPESRTKTGLRSRSTPGGEGYNELSFEDRAGEELVHLRAQRDLEFVALRDERTSIGANRTTRIHRSDRQQVGGDLKLEVRGDQFVTVAGTKTEVIEGGLQSRSGSRSGISVEDGKIVISNGQASIVLDGPIVRIDSASNIWLRSDRLVTISSKKVTIDKEVSIEEHDLVPPDVAKLVALPSSSNDPGSATPKSAEAPGQPPPAQPAQIVPGGSDDAKFDAMKVYEDLLAKAGVKVKLPKHLPLPPSINEQLQHYARVIHKADVVQGRLMDPATYEAMKDRFRSRLDAEARRLQRIGDTVRSTFEKNRAHLSDLGDTLGDRLAFEGDNLAKLRTDLGDIFSGNRGNFTESCKALYEVFKEQRAHVMALREDVLALIETEKKWLKETFGEWTDIANSVQGMLDDMKSLVENPKDALLQLALGPDGGLGKDITSLAEEFGLGEEVASFFGFGQPDAAAKSPGLLASSPGKVFATPNHSGAFSKAPALGALVGGGKGSLSSAGLQSHAPSFSSAALMSPSASPTSNSGSGTVISRAGGIAAKDILTAAAPGKVGFLQGPFDGQKMVVATEFAQALDGHGLTEQLVAAQLRGQAPGEAMNGLLESKGYVVYERPWDDFVGPFVQAAESQAGG